MGSGTLEVFATPALVALAEKTCWMSVADALGEGNGSVGTCWKLTRRRSGWSKQSRRMKNSFLRQRPRPLSHLRCQLSQGESLWQNRELYRTAKASLIEKDFPRPGEDVV